MEIDRFIKIKEQQIFDISIHISLYLFYLISSYEFMKERFWVVWSLLPSDPNRKIFLNFFFQIIINIWIYIP